MTEMIYSIFQEVSSRIKKEISRLINIVQEYNLNKDQDKCPTYAIAVPLIGRMKELRKRIDNALAEMTEEYQHQIEKANQSAQVMLALSNISMGMNSVLAKEFSESIAERLMKGK